MNQVKSPTDNIFGLFCYLQH